MAGRHGWRGSEALPIEIVFHPSWWHAREGIIFNEDFYFDPRNRVQTEQRMERALHERWGGFGLGSMHSVERPEVGPVHLAAGYIVSAMLGCRITYPPDASPAVSCANADGAAIDIDEAFRTPIFRKLVALMDSLKNTYGFLCGDINWSGVLNVALDLRGEALFLDMADAPANVSQYFLAIAHVIDRFTRMVREQTGSTSISVNRTVRHFAQPVFLHSECSNTMISADDYERFILPIDAAWSRAHRPFGVHHCGADPHRFAGSYAKIPHLDFLDVGWGGDVAALRAALPATFLNIRLSPVEIARMSTDEIRKTIRGLVRQSKDPLLTGVCCINVGPEIDDDRITTILQIVTELRTEPSDVGESP